MTAGCGTACALGPARRHERQSTVPLRLMWSVTMHEVDSLAPIILQSWLMVAGLAILYGRLRRALRRRRDPWVELARRTVPPQR
jgi:hypothetical protein